LLSGIYCPVFRPYAKYGLYVIRFYIDSNWVYVIIDDRLPCISRPHKKLVFARCCNSHELWVPLIEKAFAKLNHCYEALATNYSVSTALTYLTGQIS